MKKILLAFCLLMVVPVACFAGTVSGMFTVSATVVGTCSITTNTGINFGQYTGTTLQATGTVGLTCTGGTAYTAYANGGNNASTTTNSRALAIDVGGVAQHTMNYQLYTDAANTTVWSESPSDAAGSAIVGTGTGTATGFQYYAAIPSGQSPFQGSYTDTITVTVDF